MLALFFCLLSLTAAAAEVGLGGKALLFSGWSNSNYVKLIPKKPLSLPAFTLCMRVATELYGKRNFVLFSYRTPNFDELTVWMQKDYLYISMQTSYGAYFPLPPLSNFFYTHLCVTKEFATGIMAFWVNGQRTMYKFSGKAHSVLPGGTVLLGQYPEKYLGGFKAERSFVGEITDVHMWDYVLSGTQIEAMYSYKDQNVLVGNIFDWNTINYHIEGNVQVVKK